MVNEKQTKRERNIRSKLMAAIAMLLVSSIMMVSTTYAWFTLSTAPEVTGITTTIASNGNLEIALSPESGLGANVGDATTTTQGWAAKNLTWGNLVDMGFEGNTYGLADLALAPAELAALGNSEAGFTLNPEGALATPKYGSDGRISELVTDAVMAHKTETGYAKPGQITNEDDTTTTESFKYGVRAVGTSSGQSAQQVKFRNALNAITTYASSATTAASTALNNNGEALASIMVQHAMGNDSDYKTHVSTLVALTNTLNNIPGYLDNAVRSALAAAACSLETATFNAAIEAIEGKNEDGSYKNTVSALITEYASGDVATALNNLMTEINGVNGKIAAASTAATGLQGAETVNWNAVSGVLTNLMNVSNDEAITVSGIKISQLKEKADAKDIPFFMGLATNCVIELRDGSGVFYDLAEIAGNIQAKTSAEIDASFMTPGVQTIVPLDNVIMKTTVSGVSKLEALKATVKAGVTAAGDSGAAALDAFYGYIIDLMVRTNAADSSLQLQSAAAQRVYAESANEATMGGGASIIFKVASTNADAETAAKENEAKASIISDLCSSIRVVFFDPSNGTNKIFSLAKVTGVGITDGTTKVTAEDGTESEVACKIVTGTIELCEMVADGDGGLFVAGNVKSSATLCPLTQNVPQAISVMVYLDGNNVTSADVLADENVVGALNLQFSSTATLNPMMNSDLFKGEEAAGN